MRTTKPDQQPALISRQLLLLLMSGIAMATSSHTFALSYAVNFYGELEHESNSDPDNSARSDLLSTLGSTVLVSQNGQYLDLDLNYGITYTDYKHNTNDNSTLANGNTNLLWRPIEEIFSWHFSHNITDTVANRGTAETTDNLRSRNQFSTGPILTVPLGKTDNIRLSATHRQVEFDNASNPNIVNSNADSKSRSASAAWLHELSATSNLEMNYNYNATERDSANSTTFFHTAYIGYSQQLRSSHYSIQLGGNRSQVNRLESDAPYYFGEYQYDFGDQQITLSTSRQKSSSAFGIASFNDQGQNNIGGTSLSQQNFDAEETIDSKSFGIDYNASRYCNSCNYGLSYTHLSSDYEGLTEDDKIDEFALSFSRQLNRRLNADLNSNHTKRRFESSSDTNQDTTTSLSFSWQQNQKVSIRFGAAYTSRKSDRAADTEYNNASAFVAFDYQVLQR